MCCHLHYQVIATCVCLQLHVLSPSFVILCVFTDGEDNTMLLLHIQNVGTAGKAGRLFPPSKDPHVTCRHIQGQSGPCDRGWHWGRSKYHNDVVSAGCGGHHPEQVGRSITVMLYECRGSGVGRQTLD